MSPSAPRIVSGTTFFWNKHLHVIITDTAKYPDRVVLVSFSRVWPGCDPACLLEPGDHPFIREKTYVAYEWARNPSLTSLQQLFQNGECEEREPASPELVQRIIDGALQSDEIPLAIQEEIRRQQM